MIGLGLKEMPAFVPWPSLKIVSMRGNDRYSIEEMAAFASRLSFNINHLNVSSFLLPYSFFFLTASRGTHVFGFSLGFF